MTDGCIIARFSKSTVNDLYTSSSFPRALFHPSDLRRDLFSHFFSPQSICSTMADSSHHHGSLALLPGTTSLHDYQVSIDPKVRDILTEQLLPLYNGNTHEARLHMERIMASLKLPPTTSLCRTNWIQSSSRKDLMEDIISSLLDSWDLSDTVDIVVQPHAQFADVVEIHASGKATAASAPIPLSRHSVPETSPDDTVLFANWPRRQQLGWPMTHRVIICDRFCSEAVLRGSHIFVKGILCADANIVEGECVAVYGYVGREKKKPNRGTHVMDIINNNGNNTIRPFLFLGLGKTHCPRSQLFSNETGIGVSMTLHRAGPILPPLNSIGRSHCMMQNLPSIVVGHALDPQPGDVILDMCCAPGGKTTHLASLVRGDATIVACDKSRTKIVGLLDLVKRMGAESCITPLVLDATKCVITINDENQDMTIQEVS
jgi:hypothetical protein